MLRLLQIIRDCSLPCALYAKPACRPGALALMPLNLFPLTLMGVCRDLNAKLGPSQFILVTELSDDSDKGPRCTFDWASPELLQGMRATCATDIYSFGVRPVRAMLLYAMESLPACMFAAAIWPPNTLHLLES